MNIENFEKAQHTPGPWVVHPTALHPAVRSVGTADIGPRRICTVGTMNGNSVDKSNACLIAAAPDLLAALNAMLTYMGMDEDDWNKPTFDQARHAVRKAIGAA